MTTTPTTTTHRFELVFESFAENATFTQRRELTIPEWKLAAFTEAFFEVCRNRDLGVDVDLSVMSTTRTDGGDDDLWGDDDTLEFIFSYITSFRRLPEQEGQAND